MVGDHNNTCPWQRGHPSAVMREAVGTQYSVLPKIQLQSACAHAIFNKLSFYCRTEICMVQLIFWYSQSISSSVSPLRRYYSCRYLEVQAVGCCMIRTGQYCGSAACALSSMATLKFARWSSVVEPAFWQSLADRKLDSMKLSEEPVPVSVRYHGAQNVREDPTPTPAMAFVLTPSSFSAPAEPGHDSHHITAPGELRLLNTASSFKELDKSELLVNTAEQIWADIRSGAAVKDPTLLNRFVLIAFADLKTWKFYYWFCFPGLFIPGDGMPQLVGAAQLASEYFGDDELAVVQNTILDYQACKPGTPVFILSLPGAVFEGVELCNPRVDSLACWASDELKAGTKAGYVHVCVVDPCTLSHSPGWVLRNALCMLSHVHKLAEVCIICLKCDRAANSVGHSLVMRVGLPLAPSSNPHQCPKAVGWEMDAKGKPRPRKTDMGPVMDPRRLAESAVDLNLKLMRWRLMPSLDTVAVAETKCLLLGAGTLGCQVSRSLLGWGVRKITLVDSGRVSFSNPVRQSLYDFQDCTQGGRPKVVAAVKRLQEIFPGVDAAGYDLSIPMPGHPVAPADVARVRSDISQLEELIVQHDVVFLLTDTRESRWLPTLIAADKGKLAFTVALGFDSFLVMRHGISPAIYDPGPWRNTDVPRDVEAPSSVHLGCYFCNDVVAPTNSMRDRTLDQQCTVTRPGLAAMSGALCVELLVNLCHHPDKGLAAATIDTSNTSAQERQPVSPLGTVPHQIRGFISDFSNMALSAQPFDCCTACSKSVRSEYRRRGADFVLEALQTPSYLEDLTGLAELQRRAADFADDAFDWDEDDAIAVEWECQRTLQILQAVRSLVLDLEIGLHAHVELYSNEFLLSFGPPRSIEGDTHRILQPSMWHRRQTGASRSARYRLWCWWQSCCKARGIGCGAGGSPVANRSEQYCSPFMLVTLGWRRHGGDVETLGPDNIERTNPTKLQYTHTHARIQIIHWCHHCKRLMSTAGTTVACDATSVSQTSFFFRLTL
eukprot:46727_4